jgi:pyruvate/2-oxoglutarate dehydrogenase complex dihydrolipoamide acyltransferase (E2) component
MPDNSTDVKVGKLIALIVEKGDDWKNVEVPKTEEKTASQKPSETKKPPTKEKEEQPKSDKQQQQPEQSQYVLFHFKTVSFLAIIYSVMLSVRLRVLF